MAKKKISFFIDSLGGGGAERVVSVLSTELISKGYDVDILMLQKREIAYNLPETVSLYYVQDMPVTTTYGKVTRKAFEIWNRFRFRVYVPILRRLGHQKYPKWNETSFYFYSQFALPYREYLRKNHRCRCGTARGQKRKHCQTAILPVSQKRYYQILQRPENQRSPALDSRGKIQHDPNFGYAPFRQSSVFFQVLQGLLQYDSPGIQGIHRIVRKAVSHRDTASFNKQECSTVLPALFYSCQTLLPPFRCGWQGIDR